MTSTRKAFLVFACYCIAAVAPAFRSGLRDPPTPPGVKLPDPQWVEQKLDNFNKTDTRTWKQRYFVNDTFWSPASGPVFLMLGGEGAANPAWLVADTEIMINTQKFSALAILIEHRYYGESHPTENISNTNIKFLSSRQALADVAYFHDVMMTQYKMSDKNRWISFGGSYSGALSAWLRQVYPDIIVGAVASSAPVMATEDFYEYLEVVQRSLASSVKGLDCVHAVKAATTQLDTLLQSEEYWKDVEDMFLISPPLTSILDVALAAQNLASNFMGVVQYNMDNTAFEGRSNAITIDTLCSMMTNTSLGSPMQRYAAVNRMFLSGPIQLTLDCSYKNMINEMSLVSYNGPVGSGGRQWYYQTCTEFGYFQTTHSPDQPFGDLISLASFTDVCSRVFNVTLRELEMSVLATNKYYGGKNVTGSNIVFPNGSIDPWHQLSIVTDISPSLRSFYIQGTAHCANMYPPSSQDPSELSQARANITMAISTWLT